MAQGLNVSVNTTSNNVLQPIFIGHEFTVLGCVNVSGNSFVIAPSADLNDNLGLANNRFANVYTYGINLGNTTLNSVGNSTANSATNPGYTVIPGGVIMQWGNGTANTTGNVQTFPITFPANTVLNVVITGTQANTLYISASNSSSLTVFASGGTPTYRFLVHGM